MLRESVRNKRTKSCPDKWLLCNNNPRDSFRFWLRNRGQYQPTSTSFTRLILLGSFQIIKWQKILETKSQRFADISDMLQHVTKLLEVFLQMSQNNISSHSAVFLRSAQYHKQSYQIITATISVQISEICVHSVILGIKFSKLVSLSEVERNSGVILDKLVAKLNSSQ